jgi:protein-S-isoprenylcysteine O-methyltransferase Ste14
VRIQRERGHYVVNTGPYRWVRHPGYAGTLIWNLATPIWLESLWAILPAIVVCAVLVVRTHLEDATLREELDGYRDYASRVRYRLVPGVW